MNLKSRKKNSSENYVFRPQFEKLWISNRDGAFLSSMIIATWKTATFCHFQPCPAGQFCGPYHLRTMAQTLCVCMYVCRVTAPPHMTRTHLGTHTHKSLMKKKNQTKNHLLHSQQLRVNTNFELKCHDLLLCELLVYFCLFSSDSLSLSLYETKFINLEFSLWEEVKICATCQQ